jgi:hypothetical protein
MSSKKLTIINRHYPPNPGITGESAWDLAKYLIEKHQIEVHIVHINRTYDGGGALREPVGITHEVATIYEGKNKFLRILVMPVDGFFLILKALSIKNSTIICMTSPPLLPFWASIFLRKKSWALWSMDLFPEGFVADNVLKSSNLFYRFIINITYRNAPQKLICLGKKQAEFVQKSYKKAINTTILPCGVIINQERETEKPAWKKDDNKIYFGYCGNLGNPHSAEFLMSFIKNINAEKHHLILAIYGVKTDKVLEFAEKRIGVTIIKNVPRSQLHFIDVHLVSLLPVWNHIAVPSKAVSSVCAEAAILFCGSTESDSWEMLKEAGWHIDIEQDLDRQNQKFLEKLTLEEVEEKRKSAKIVAQNLNEMVINAYEEIAEFV